MGVTNLRFPSTWINLVKQLPLPLILLDKAGEVIAVNPPASDLFDLGAVSVVGRSCDHLLEKYVADLPTSCLLEELFDEPKVTSWPQDVTLRSGKTLHLRLTSVPFYVPNRGLMGLGIMIEDLTEYIMTKRARFTTKRALLHLTDVDVYIIDANGRIIFSNREPESSVGLPFGVALSHSGRLEEAGHYLDLILDVLNGSTGPVHKVIPDNTKQRYDRVDILRLSNEEDELLGVVCLAVDITREIRLQEQLERGRHLASVGDLAATTAHELRNPMAVIRATAELGMSVDIPEKKNEAFQRIVHEVDRLNGLIDKLLVLSRPASPLDREAFSLDELLEEVLVLVHGQMIVNNVRITRKYAPGQPKIRGSKRLLRHAFLNLVQNAIESMSGPGRLGLSTHLTGDFIQVDISDTGVGMSQELLDNLFGPVFAMKKSGHSGFGLALAYQIIVTYHGGKIWFDSEVDQGTTAHVRLPATAVTE